MLKVIPETGHVH